MTAREITNSALLTSLAPGAIAVIGVVGPQTEAVLSKVLRRADGNQLRALPDRRPILCCLVDDGDVIDDVVVVQTGRGRNAMAEINTHGGVRIAQRTLALLAQCGAETISGEVFMQRCSPSNRNELTVDQALLAARSRRLTQWLLCQRRILPPFLAAISKCSSAERAAFASRSEVAIRLLAGLNVALVGPPNSGKSTLANRLIGHDRVVISDEAGTTRDWVSETALINGWPVTLTDTAGIRSAYCEIEADAIRRGSARAGAADLVVVVMDASASPGDLKSQLEATVTHVPGDRLPLVVLNKCDIAGDRSPGGVCEPEGWLCISALTGDGCEELEARIECLLGLDTLDDRLPTAVIADQLEEVLRS